MWRRRRTEWIRRQLPDRRPGRSNLSDLSARWDPSNPWPQSRLWSLGIRSGRCLPSPLEFRGGRWALLDRYLLSPQEFQESQWVLLDRYLLSPQEFQEGRWVLLDPYLLSPLEFQVFR